MSDAERAEARAIVMWRVLIATYDAWPHRILLTPEQALGKPIPDWKPELDLRTFGMVQGTEETHAYQLLKRMLEEGIIAGDLKDRARFDIVTSPIARAAFRQPAAEDGTWLSEVVRKALAALGTMEAAPAGSFLRWATFLGFEP